MSIYKTMVELQHQFNKKIDENYLDKDFNWNSAIIAESGELLDSLGYKWWNQQTPDMDNVKVEAIDLLHFVISEAIQDFYRPKYMEHIVIENTYKDFEAYFTENEQYDNFTILSLETLIGHLNYDQYDRFFIMKKIFKSLEMSNEDVYIAYIVKNCLNKFRQDNGYKDGSYIKDWNGKEDNVIAYEIANKWGADEELFHHLCLDLTTYYNEEVLIK